MTKQNGDNFSFAQGMLVKISHKKRSEIIGDIVLLMLSSKLHRKYFINDIGSVIFPALHFDQFRIYKDKENNPVAFITWAFLSDEVEKKYLKGDYHLKPQDWQSGKNGWVIDFVAPFGHAKKIIEDLKNNIFSNMEGKALRMDGDFKVRKIMKLKGKKV